MGFFPCFHQAACCLLPESFVRVRRALHAKVIMVWSAAAVRGNSSNIIISFLPLLMQTTKGEKEAGLLRIPLHLYRALLWYILLTTLLRLLLLHKAFLLDSVFKKQRNRDFKKQVGTFSVTTFTIMLGFSQSILQ